MPAGFAEVVSVQPDDADRSDDAPRWSGIFVGDDGNGGPVPRFRHTFVIEKPPLAAALTATFLGIGKIFINGVRVGDEALAPGWQSYSHRLLYSTADVLALLQPGVNTIVAEVGDGWYAGRLGFLGQRAIYGTRRAVFAELEISDETGTSQRVVTDGSWLWRPSATLASDLYDGEIFDARLAQSPDDAGELWHPVAVVPFDLERLEPAVAPPVRRIERVTPVSVLRSPTDRTIVDFGRNLVGWTNITVSGRRGTEVILRHAEVLEHGELGTRPLRSAAATDRYILAGDGNENWEPSFTYHGFRFVDVENWPTEIDLRSGIAAIVVHSDMRPTGWFRTSHAGLATLHANVVASMRGNFVSIPTDCPQRDERLGWTGDIAVFAPTALFLYDAADFLQSWLRDVRLEQSSDGRIPLFVPEVPFPHEAARANPQFAGVRSAVWGDASTIVPSALYDATGDRRFLASNFELMRRWVDGVEQAVGPSRIWDADFQFGDWLDPTAPSDDPAAGATDPALIATGYFAHSARLTARAADLLGDPDLSAHYSRLADEVTRAFQETFVDAQRRLTSDSQTAYAMAIVLGLLTDEADRRLAGERLVELVRAAGHRIGTGFVGTPLILDALTKSGAIEDAYRLLLQEQAPSWLYAVGMGATTIWERWDSMLPDGSINPGEMTSFNHYAFGAVASWLHSTAAGLSADTAGYERIRIAPRPRPPLTDAGATHETPYGSAAVDWRIDGATLVVEVLIPPGTVAIIDLENHPPDERGPGRHLIRVPYPSVVSTDSTSA